MSNLSKIIIPDSVKTIGDFAFMQCSNLHTISLGTSVEKIGDYSLCFCSALDTITCKTYVPPVVDEFTFEEVPSSVFVKVPCGYENLYRAEDGWSSFVNYKTIHSNEIYNVKILSSNSQYGYVEYYYDGCTLILNAIASPDCIFQQWEDGSTDNPRYEEITQDTTFIAIFAENSIGDGLGDIVVDGLEPRKILRNNQILILRGDKTYTLTGQQVK